jgi:hypothetical protein
MKSAGDSYCIDLAEPLDWTKQRRIFGQSEMGPDMVVPVDSRQIHGEA